ncbi:MAG: DNA-formamidopyrimidine glycosylase family protein [Acidobacteriota bacterium]
MPELPDVELYLHALTTRVVGRRLERIRLASPFLLRSVRPPISTAEGKAVTGLRRIGKRIVFEQEDELFLVIHLMVAGRFQWKPRHEGDPPAKIPGRLGSAAFDFAAGTLLLTEAGSKKRASLHLVEGEKGLRLHDPGGIEPLTSPDEAVLAALRAENHTLKRALTDPHILAGIGNAYSDEILHRAQLSPFKQTKHLTDDEGDRLLQAMRAVLTEWIERLQTETGDGFPKKVTAFRPEMAVHGRYREPCPECGAPVQRILYAENESNYCAPCQTGGKLLADRVLSKLLKGDWPKTLEELERRKDAAS